MVVGENMNSLRSSGGIWLTIGIVEGLQLYLNDYR